jgi:hypothetical protein
VLSTGNPLRLRSCSRARTPIPRGASTSSRSTRGCGSTSTRCRWSGRPSAT